MRLTLRTLLAYMDDTLEPVQAREIGQKIAESDIATALVERIRDVLRRRRLTAPDVDGPAAGLDPNLIAEYLDNTLPAPGVADVERVCLDSDVHLAEVAACHQILTLALGEPVHVRPESRERLLALIPHAEVAEPPPVPTPASGNGAAAQPPAPARREPAARPQAAAAATVAVPTHEDFAASIPEYLRPRPLWRRALPVLLVLLLAGAWVGLLFYDPTLVGLGHHEPASDDGDITVAQADDRQGQQPEPPAPAARNNEPPPPANAAAQNRQKPPQPLGPPPPPDQAIVGTNGLPPMNPPPANDAGIRPENAPPQAVAANVPQPMPPAAADQVAQPMPPGKGQPAPAAAEPAPAVQYTSHDGLLLRYDPMADAWFAVPYDSTLRAGTRVALPEPFQAQFGVGKNLATVTLQGGTALRWLEMPPAGAFGLDIERGLVTVETTKDAPADGVTFSLAIGTDQFRIKAAPQTRLGFQVEIRTPEGFEQPPGEHWYRAAVYLAAGSATLDDAQGWSRTIANGPAFLSLSPEDRQADTAPAAAQPLGQLPNWLNPEPMPPSRAVRQTALNFEKAFDRDRVMLLSVPAIAKGDRPAVAEVAVRTLAVTDSLGALADVLAYEGTSEEARQAAILGLRAWLGRHVDQADQLREALLRHLREETADAVYHLLWGYNQENARDPMLSRELVGYLDHPHIAIRELAIWNLYRLTGLRYDYRPLAPEPQRRSAIRRWQTYLERNGGTLISTKGEKGEEEPKP